MTFGEGSAQPERQGAGGGSKKKAAGQNKQSQKGVNKSQNHRKTKKMGGALENPRRDKQSLFQS